MSEPFYLNASGVSARYGIVRFVDAVATPPAHIISAGAGNAGYGVIHVAWPSAIKSPDGKTRVFASRHNGARWNDVAQWCAADEINFTMDGVSLAANAAEPNGIGPSQVYYAAGEVRPWHMVYAIRNAQQSSTVLALADSVTGEPGSWTRAGNVLQSSEPREAFGVSPSFVAEVEPGVWALTYHAYRDAAYASAAIATAASPKGPFTNKKIIMAPSEHALTITAERLRNTGTVNAPVRLNEPYVLRGAGAMELIVPVRQEGARVWFDRPLLGSYSGAEMSHLARHKVDPSHIRKTDSGWEGDFTGYGLWSDVLTEYTFRAVAPAYDGPWTIAKGVPFAPWFSDGLNSTENPSPVQIIAP